jgi:soluble lytic murein transglycosylase
MKTIRYLFFVLAALTLACRIPLAQSTEAPSGVTPTVLPIFTHLPGDPTPTPTTLPQPQIEADPIQTESDLDAAEWATFIGDWPNAMAEYQKALEAARDPEAQSAALAGLGRTHFYQGDDYNARQVLESLIEVNPTSAYAPEAHYYLAQIEMNLSRPLEAAEAYQKYLDLRPGVIDVYIHANRADALWAAGDYPGALAAYQAAINSPRLTPNADLEIQLAQAYVMAGDTATALVMYPDIYQRSSADYQKAKVDLLLGQLHASLNQPDAAYAAWLDAVNNFPTTADAFQALVELVNAGYPVDELQRGIVDYYAGEYSVALAALDRYLAAEPADPARAYYFRGLVLRALNDEVNAVAMWDYAIQNYPDTPLADQIWEQKGFTQWAYLDEYPQAVQTFLDFAATYPIHARAAEFIFNAARVAERDGDLALASQLWQKMVAEYPTHEQAFEAAFLAGIADYRQNNIPTSQAQFLRAQQIAVAPQDLAKAYLWIGKTYQAQGEEDTARSFWTLGADIDPTGYYSERSGDLAKGLAPLTPPQMFDFGYDAEAERKQAEDWLRQTFTLEATIDLAGPGELASEPRLVRGLELWNLGQFDLATNELDNLRMALVNDPANSFRLMNLLLEKGIYRLAILSSRQVLDLAGLDDAGTLTAPMYFNRIRFGNYYATLIIPAAQQYSMHPILVWSIIRQESLFDATIRSSAGANGLMQIIPGTGQDIANRLGWPPNYSSQDLLRPQVSIRFGLDYLSDQINYLEGNLFAALAGYNAGPGNAATWRTLAPQDPDLFLEVIRFPEPKRYIQGIYENFAIYRKLYDRTP